MIISVDPGNPCGWAIWTADHALSAYGMLDGADAATVTALLGRFVGDCRGVHLVVEGQWYRESEPVLERMERGPSGEWRPVFRKRRTVGAHFGSVEKVIESRCSWVDACLIAGMTSEVVPPAVWIPAMTKGHPERDPRLRVRAVVEGRWPSLSRAMTGDEAAAILLGEWAIEERRGRALKSGVPARYRGLEPAKRRPSREEDGSGKGA